MPGSQNREDINTEDVLNYINNRFGVKVENLDKFNIVEISGDFWLISDQELPDLDYKTQGVRFVRDTGKYLKPTTYGLQIQGEKISGARIQVTREELKTVLNGDMVEKEMEIGEGYVAIVYEERVIGCGLYKDGLLSSRIPKGRGKELNDMI
ncbi:hypothetical protein GLU64_01390 [Nanohaloarchaea archaeon]|nr:hypothetical protein [Candidatus Nanohaloarchaea archaeon]